MLQTSRSNMHSIVSLLILITSIIYTFADTPANCTYDDITGDWIFYQSETSMDPNIDCSKMPSIVRKIRINLKPDDVAEENSWLLGKWTMVYNQGFEVNINSRTYFAFSMYKQIENNVTSVCSRTFVGKSHDSTLRNYACFYGNKLGSPIHKHHLDPFLDLYKSPPFEKSHHEEIVQKVNDLQSSWFAEVYEPFVTKTPAELLSYRGGPRSYLAHKVRTTLHLGSRLLTATNDTALDWRNYKGMNFVSPVRDQGQCGSCYAFSSVGMIESRLRYLSKNDIQTVLSPQDIVSCTDLAQGCSGGFPYLIAGRYGWERGLVEESCNPYQGFDKSCPRNNCTKNRKYTSKYTYIGGAYGKSNELSIMEALKRGPVSVSFDVHPDFMHYKSGIYHYTGVKGMEPFIVVNHAVLAVGYGVDSETGQKYWIIKNSWGENWGEKGYFRIRRGVDEVGIESCAVEAIPIPY